MDSKLTHFIAIFGWSVATLAQGYAIGLGSLIGLRTLTCLFEALEFPTNNRMVTSWFLERERASAVGLFTSGQFVDFEFLTPLLFWVQKLLSWHWMFILTGGIGIVWALIWFLVYQSPRKSGGLVDGDAPVEKKSATHDPR